MAHRSATAAYAASVARKPATAARRSAASRAPPGGGGGASYAGDATRTPSGCACPRGT
jgi:hypothetical protein